MRPLLGFTPDAPTTAPGIILDCTNWIPYEDGTGAGPSAVAQGSAALAATCRGAASFTKLDGNRRVFSGTSTKLYELSGTTWNDVSRAGSYTLGANSRWSFTQFGDTSLASNLDNVIQSSNTGAFADIATAPRAAVIESVLSSGGGFVIAFNTVDGTYGTSPDRWWCCAVNDVTNWTPNVSTQATTGRLLGQPGPVTTAKQFGSDRIIAYKNRSIYVGTYIGPPAVWSWVEIPSIGCVGKDAVCDLGTAHFFLGEDDFYIFDGARPVGVGDGIVRKWFFENSDANYRNQTQIVFDRYRKLVWVNFVGNGSTTLNRCLTYRVPNQLWGKADRAVQQTFLFVQPTETFDSASGTFDSDTGTFDDVPAGELVYSYFDETNTMQILNGAPGASSFTLCDVGDDNIVSQLGDVRLGYTRSPTTASVTGYASMQTGGSPTAFLTASSYDAPSSANNRFTPRQSGRFHRLQFNFTGPVKANRFDAPLKAMGGR